MGVLVIVLAHGRLLVSRMRAVVILPVLVLLVPVVVMLMPVVVVLVLMTRHGDERRVDEGRVITEVAIWADKSDVTEELARLRAHLEQFTTTLDKGGAVGRALDFLIQELGREINTAASKGDDLELSQAAIAAKGVLEKMREQVQNLE